MNVQERRISFLTVLFSEFIDYAGIALVYPLFAYMLSYGLAGGIDMLINSPGAKQWMHETMNIGHNIIRTTSGYIHLGPGAWWLEGWWGVCLVAVPYAVICTAITMLANRLKVIVRL